MIPSRPGWSTWSVGLALTAILALLPMFFAVPPAMAAPEESAAASIASQGMTAAEVATVDRVETANLSNFRPGNIVSNEVFYNSAAMGEADIQSFLQQRVPRCQTGYTCLKDYSQATDSRAADAYCSSYSGSNWESAARIIWKVAQACGINPQVLLVTLQKEQGLVTHTAPSALRFRIAMGQGCPDTAACDQRYYGFFNQVMGAAKQFRIYSVSQNFKYYAPGRTWNVRFHPNTACGSSPVYIENQATANLYYYTPYQPNPSALAAGFGTGDACGSYGNRNFYNYFTDWFGSTQVSNLTIAKTAAGADVFLVSGSSRWRIGDAESYGELNAAFGPTHVVSEGTLSAFTLRGTTGSVLHDASSGVIAIVQGGQLHRITSCEHVLIWGSSCASPTTVSSALFARLSTGAEAGLHFRVRGTETWGRFDSPTQASTMYNHAAAAAANGTVGNPPYAPFISAGRYAALTKTRTYFAPAQLVKSTTDAKVYLTAEFDRLLWVRSWADVADYNRGPANLAVVAPADLAHYRETGTVTPTLECEGATYFPAGGWLYRLANPANVGLAATSVTRATCAQFSVAAADGLNTLAIKSASAADVMIVEAGKRRAVLTWDLLIASNGGTVPRIATVEASTIAALPVGPSLADGQVIRAASSPDLQIISETTSHWVTSAGIAADLGIPLAHHVLADADAGQYTKGAAVGLWVSCGDHIGFAASGRIWPITAEAAAGFAPLRLSAAVCARMTWDSAVPRSLVFVKSVSSADVFVAENGTLRHVTSWDALLRLGGGSIPPILTTSVAGLGSMTRGVPVV